jgi:hypothetical protein
MKKIIAGLLMTLLVGFVYGQKEFYGKDIATKLKSLKLAVVLDGSDSYNLKLKQAVEQNWKLSHFEFVDGTTFETLKTNPEYSFLVTLSGTANNLPTDFFTLAMGNKKKAEAPTVLKELIVDKEKINTTGAPMVELYVKNMLLYINGIADGKISETATSARFISNNTRLIKESKLLLLASDLDKTVADVAKQQEFFKGTLQIVNQDAINEAIHNGEAVGVADVILTGERDTRYCYKRVFLASTGALIYLQDTEALYGKKTGFFDTDLKIFDRAK